MNAAEAFPTLDDEQMEAIARIADLVDFTAGETLVEYGQKDYPFFVVNSGAFEIVEPEDDGELVIATHGPRAFSGDVDMLTGRAAIFRARAKESLQAYRLCAGRLRTILGECPAVGDMLLTAFLNRRRLLSQLPFVGVRVIGDPIAAETARLREFFYKNHVPHTFIESDTDQATEQLRRLSAQTMPLPVVHCNGQTVSNPSLPELARCIGVNRDVDQQQFDLVIVGAGPAGLAAAVYAASEGLKVLVIDRVGPGGQAGSSSKIENFMGFPSGLSGSELAGRGYLQALKFGAQFIAPVSVESIESIPSGHQLRLDNDQSVLASSVLIATGVSYRQLQIPGCREFEGAGVYYAATSVEARVCENQTAIVVGGGNSAGQAAMFLAERASCVKLLIRGDDLAKSMSAYLCERVLNHPKIELMPHTEIESIHGDRAVRSVKVINNMDQSTDEIPCAGLFIFIGAKAHTGWLPKNIMLDDKGFVLTGASFINDETIRSHWPLERPPCELETTVPGILTGGDVRSGTTKRCGFAVGDGSLAVACVHRLLSLTGST